MGLIALTTDPELGPQSVVVSNRDFKPDGTAILIRDGDDEQLKVDATECNSGYDLCVGKVFRDHRNEYAQELGDSDKISLLPGNAVIIQTQEWVEFPERRFGQIFPKVRLLQRGIANTPSKVDPGFRGNLLITVFNYGKRKEYLCPGQRFCSLHVFNVEGTVRPYEKPPPDRSSAVGGLAAEFWRLDRSKRRKSFYRDLGSHGRRAPAAWVIEYV